MIKKSIINSIILLAILFISCDDSKDIPAEPEETYYENQMELPSEATLDQKIEMASCLTPSPEQLAWHKMELIAFLHFGINTFTEKEWGDGTEDPALFNPSELDANQWVKSLKDAGFKMVILTAKHHDGFCLWPTKTTTHSVASSSWKDGKGDVVREVKDACDKYDLKFGFYLSPWDRNAPSYGSSEYNQFFIEQLTELLTNYGIITEIWFDGANGEGPNGKRQVYDWNAYREVIRQIQPQALTAIAGEHIRWVGNESGLGRQTEWSCTPFTPVTYPNAAAENKKLGLSLVSEDLGSREILKNATKLYWYPSEVDVSIRPGWFYHENEDAEVKSLSHLIDIYFQSVGYNSVLLLNIPPDKRGLINKNDISRLKEFSTYLNNTFSENLVSEGQTPSSIQQGNSIEFRLKKDTLLNVLLIQEDISKGQRIEGFVFEAWVNQKWEKVVEGTTVGYKRLLRISPIKTSKLRLTITSSRNKVNIRNIGAYYGQDIQP